MAMALQYRIADGMILGVWNAPSLDLVQAQMREDDADTGYILHPEPTQSEDELLSRWYIIGGAITAKTELTITADPSPFPADGVTVCTITVTPFHACTLLVNGTPTDLTIGDEELALTSDSPDTFVITLAPLAPYWAVPLTVEAT